jgi:hypothetical protein
VKRSRRRRSCCSSSSSSSSSDVQMDPAGDPCVRAPKWDGHSIPAGSFIWFTSIIRIHTSKVQAPAGTTLSITNQTITSSDFTIPVPDGTLTFSGSCDNKTGGSGATSFVGAGWQTNAPVNFNNDMFISGVLYQVPTTIPGGLQNVSWCGTFTSPTLSQVCWQWSAAVYSSGATTDYNAMQVKPLHSNICDAYHNGDQAGTPEANKPFIRPGAMGGGGGNFVGNRTSPFCFAPQSCAVGSSTCGSTACCPSGQCCNDVCCPPGSTCCGGVCADTSSSVTNCGSCGHVCNGSNGTPSCVAGQCEITCNPGFANCDGNPNNGCETNLNTSVLNCGSCGHICSFPHATPACTAGACIIAACNPPFANCSGNPFNPNGCDINTQTDPNNCGTCGLVCPTGLSCNFGICS